MRTSRPYINEKVSNETYQGMVTTEKSITIPGQDMTPTELIARFTSAPRPEHLYINDLGADTYSKMDTLEKLEFMKDLQSRTQIHTDAIRSRMAELEKEQSIKDRLAEITNQDVKYNDDKTTNKNDIVD